MHTNALRVQAALRDLGREVDIFEFPAGTRTSAEAAAAIGTSVAQIAKSMIFTTGETGVLVVTSGVNRVSADKVSALVGQKVRRADADMVRRLTGFPIGGVPPVAHSGDNFVLIDEDLLRFDEVWAAAGTPNTVFPTSPADLVEMTGGRVADIKEP